MRGKAVLFLAFVLLPQFSSSHITFERTYGRLGYDWGSSVQQTFDGGYIIAGGTKSFSINWTNEVYLIKTDPMGDTLWTRTFGFGGSNFCAHGNSVQQTSDGGYIITGLTNSYCTGGGGDVLMIKTDSQGDTLWTKSFGGSAEDIGQSVDQTSDGGYIIAGWTYSFGSGSSDIYLIKTNSLGDTLWTKTYGGTFEEKCYSAQQTTDGGYILTGWTGSFGAGAADVYLIKTNSSGEVLWTRTYGYTYSEVGHSVQQTSDGGYIIAGQLWYSGPGTTNFYVIKTDSVGDTLWTRIYGDDFDYAFSIQQTSDGGYIVAGFTYPWPGDAYLIKTDSIGDTLWTRRYGGTDSDIAYAVQQTQDGGYIIAGATESFDAVSRDVYLIKIGPISTQCSTFDDLIHKIAEAPIYSRGIKYSLQSKVSNSKRQYEHGNLQTSGNILCALLHEIDAQDGKHIDPPTAQEIRDCVRSLAEDLGIPLPCLRRNITKASLPIENSPNPFHSSTTFRYQIPMTNPPLSPFIKEGQGDLHTIRLAIYDITGRLVKTLVNERQESGVYRVQWNGRDEEERDVPSGIYFYRLQIFLPSF